MSDLQTKRELYAAHMAALHQTYRELHKLLAQAREVCYTLPGLFADWHPDIPKPEKLKRALIQAQLELANEGGASIRTARELESALRALDLPEPPTGWKAAYARAKTQARKEAGR